MAEQGKHPALQEIKVKGNQLVEKVREIIEEGNARRIIIKKDGRSVMEFPLSVGVGAASAAILISPTLAAIGAFASLVSDVSIAVEPHTPASPSELPASTGTPSSATGTTGTSTAGSPLTGSPTGASSPSAPSPTGASSPTSSSATNP